MDLARLTVPIPAIQVAWLAMQAGHYRWLRQASLAPEEAWAKRWSELQAVLGPSAQGRDLGLAGLSLGSIPGGLAVRGWVEHRPYVDRVLAGETGVMTSEAVDLVEPTGGSTGGTKLVPYTPRLRAEFARAVGAWMVDLHRREPRLMGTRSYWSVSRAVRTQGQTAGGLPIGLPDDSAYLGPVSRWALSRLFAVPGSVAQAETIEAWRRETAAALVEAQDLGLISVWSPTFLTRLVDYILEDDGLPGALSAGAADRLRAARGRTLDLSVLWPRLAVVSCWTHGFAGPLAAELGGRLPPGVLLQGKGLLATEGVVSIPFGYGDPVVVPAHLVELWDLEAGRAVWPWEARIGRRYQPLLTTGAGLVRYPLPDEVLVTGFHRRLPRIRLVGRLDKGSDLVGEKLTPGFVAQALAGVEGFAMLVPEGQGYVLVVDQEPPDPRSLDGRLREAYHYAYAQDLGQLAPLRVRRVEGAWGRWERACEAAGATLGGQKPDRLEVRPAVIAALLEGS